MAEDGSPRAGAQWAALADTCLLAFDAQKGAWCCRYWSQEALPQCFIAWGYTSQETYETMIRQVVADYVRLQRAAQPAATPAEGPSHG